MGETNTYNQNMKWIRQPVTFFEIKTSKKLPEQLTTYVWRSATRQGNAHESH